MRKNFFARWRSNFLTGLAVIIACPVGGASANSYPPQLAKFCTAKERQESQLARELHVTLPAEVKDFFNSAHEGNYEVLSNTVARLGAQLASGYNNFTNGLPDWMPFWQPMTEVEAGYEPFAHGGTKYPLDFGLGIIGSIPTGSVYFGGTDAGRMLVTALSSDHAAGKPFFTLTQNALSDSRYMDYLRAMYGARIHLPSTNDVQKAVSDYKADALRRYTEGRLHQGEMVQDGEVQLNGPVPVMAIHALIVKWILNHNPAPEFYYEESYPLDVLYPNLTPHGLIFKLNHEPLPAIPAADLDASREYWSRQCGSMLGDWLKPSTSLSNVCDFVDTVYGHRDLSNFKGDPAYVTNDFAPKAFSKLRVSMAGLYSWRLSQGRDGGDTTRLQDEADFAFRQAYALCPTSPEVIFRYAGYLMSQQRFIDAKMLVHTTLEITPTDDHYYDQYENLMVQLRQYR